MTIDEYIDKWHTIRNNPKYWSNNKRKNHGLPLRRKRKGQKINRPNFFKENEQELFADMKQVITKELEYMVEFEYFKNMIDIRAIPYGDTI